MNYPSCGLYAAVLDAVARLYQMPELATKASWLRDTIRRQSFGGQFFVDNAVRKGGKLEVTANRTEVCQYFAFFFGVATPASHSKLWHTLATDFGPQRRTTGAFPQIHPANAFVGNQLRFKLLSRDGRNQQILDEAIGYWLYMVERTGALWENDGPEASCNHGFASHAAHVLLRDVLGLYRVDPLGKSLHVRFGEVKLDWCRGSIPTPEGPIDLKWTKAGADLRYSLVTPSGYQVKIEDLTGRTLLKD